MTAKAAESQVEPVRRCCLQEVNPQQGTPDQNQPGLNLQKHQHGDCCAHLCQLNMSTCCAVFKEYQKEGARSQGAVAVAPRTAHAREVPKFLAATAQARPQLSRGSGKEPHFLHCFARSQFERLRCCKRPPSARPRVAMDASVQRVEELKLRLRYNLGRLKYFTWLSAVKLNSTLVLVLDFKGLVDLNGHG